jgi:malate/lactate dehydrogenase
VADLQHGLHFVPAVTVFGSDDVEVCRDADVLVLTAGAPVRPGQRRLDLAAGSVAIYRDLLGSTRPERSAPNSTRWDFDGGALSRGRQLAGLTT